MSAIQVSLFPPCARAPLRSIVGPRRRQVVGEAGAGSPVVGHVPRASRRCTPRLFGTERAFGCCPRFARCLWALLHPRCPPHNASRRLLRCVFPSRATLTFGPLALLPSRILQQQKARTRPRSRPRWPTRAPQLPRCGVRRRGTRWPQSRLGGLRRPESEQVRTELRGEIREMIDVLAFDHKCRLLGVAPRHSGLRIETAATHSRAIFPVRRPVVACRRDSMHVEPRAAADVSEQSIGRAAMTPDCQYMWASHREEVARATSVAAVKEAVERLAHSL